MKPIVHALALLALVAGCKKAEEEEKSEVGPLGIPLAMDGKIYAGAAIIDLTPEIVETFTDLPNDDGEYNNTFDGCLDDPDAKGDDCREPFDDVNGNGWFDAVWIGGFGPLRPAEDVHDPVEARALVLSYNGEYVAFVSMDLVGLSRVRIHAGRDMLVEEGFEEHRLLAASTHNHQGPDAMGLWGDPENGVSGVREEYQERISEAIAESVRVAASDMVPVELTVGSVHMRDWDPKWLNGGNFGGKNPDPIMHGMVHDGRDPVVVSDQLLVMQGNTPGGDTVFTYTNWSGHPEVWDGNNRSISSDWPGVTRGALEHMYGGIAIHMPESLGGMQSALSGELPLYDKDGNRVMSGEKDKDGDEVPVWAETDSWEFVRSHGYIIAHAAADALEGGKQYTKAPIRIEREALFFPLENQAYQALAPTGIFDVDLSDLVADPEFCPNGGCIPANTFRLQVGPIGFISAPGELLPELSWGFPTDNHWKAEESDPTARGDGGRYFPQHPRECDTIDPVECTDTYELDNDDGGVCSCLRVHAWPYQLDESGTYGPMLAHFDGDDDIEFRAILGMTDDNYSYIIPEPDYNHQVPLTLLLGDSPQDHYEDTVSPSSRFATALLEAQQRISERW